MSTLSPHLLRGKLLLFLGLGAILVVACSGSTGAPSANEQLSKRVQPVKSDPASPGSFHQAPGPQVSVGDYCSKTQQGLELDEHIHAVTELPSGRYGTVDIVRNLNDDTYHEEGAYKLSGKVIFSYAADASPASPVHATVKWGPWVHGSDAADVSLLNGTITGTVNSRSFEPFSQSDDPTTVAFVDGKPSPKIITEGIAKATVKLLADKAKSLATGCQPTSANAPPAMQPLSAYTQDPGHFTNTYGAGSCKTCKALVYTGGGAAAVGCGAACVASLGLACGACVVGDVLGHGGWDPRLREFRGLLSSTLRGWHGVDLLRRRRDLSQRQHGIVLQRRKAAVRRPPLLRQRSVMHFHRGKQGHLLPGHSGLRPELLRTRREVSEHRDQLVLPHRTDLRLDLLRLGARLLC